MNAEIHITDYSKEDYILIEDGKVAIYNNTGELFHTTNISYYKELIDSIDPRSTGKELQLKISFANKLANQLTMARTKRGIDELGKLWKWISGTPDHEDQINIETKLKELIISNNKQFEVNSKLFKSIQQIANGEYHDKDEQNYLLISHIIIELTEVINTINLSKNNILNTIIFNQEEIKEIIKIEPKEILLIDVLDASVFHIIQTKDIIVTYIKYPIINGIGKHFKTFSVHTPDGKLVIPTDVTLYKNSYTTNNCKQELNIKICEYMKKQNCLTNLLNKNKSNCTKILEKNPTINIINHNHIVTSGEVFINNETYYGTQLIQYTGTIKINNQLFVNLESSIDKHKKFNQDSDIKVVEYIRSGNELLKFTNIDYILPYVENVKKHPVLWGITINTIVIISAFITYKLVVVYKARRQQRDHRNFELLLEHTNRNVQRNVEEFRLERLGQTSSGVGRS